MRVPPSLAWPQAHIVGLRHFGPLLAFALALLAALFDWLGAAKPLATWHWMDIVSEGSTTLMVAVWLAYLRASRPAGRVTDWLCLGLTAMLIGSFTDLLDEFWALPKSMLWDNALEALMPLGMLALSVGLHHWRQEQLVLNRQLRQRERHFRDHRAIDGVTQLGDAGYMSEQIALERRLGRAGTVLMLAFEGFAALTRRHGVAEADRALAAASLTLLLNLRADDLLCRYAGDRFLVLLPDCSGAAAAELAQQLREALAHLSLSLRDGSRLRLPVQIALAPSEGEQAPEQLLLGLLTRLA